MAPFTSVVAEYQHHLSSCHPQVKPASLTRLVYCHRSSCGHFASHSHPKRPPPSVLECFNVRRQNSAGTSQDYQTTAKLLQEPPRRACSKGSDCSEACGQHQEEQKNHSSKNEAGSAKIDKCPESSLQTALAERCLSARTKSLLPTSMEARTGIATVTAAPTMASMHAWMRPNLCFGDTSLSSLLPTVSSNCL